MLLQDSDTIMTVLLGMGIVMLIVVILIAIAISTLFLMIGLKAVDGNKREFGAVFVTTLLNMLVGIIPLIGCILQWVVINKRHDTGFGKAILAWLIAIVIPAVIMVVIMMLLGFPITSMFGGYGY